MNDTTTIQRITTILKNLNALGFENIPSTLKYSALKDAKLDVNNCKECSLHTQCDTPIFGEGNPFASLMVIGDVPDENEVFEGKPFAGEQGDLFSNLLFKLGLNRADLYITNIIKCHYKNPIAQLDDDMINCLVHLNRQIEIVSPKVILVMGNAASKCLLSTDKDIKELRGRFYDYNGIKVMPTFHTSHFIKASQDKSLTWGDAKMVLKELSG